MKQVSEQLKDTRVVRCHRSYMVNIDAIKVLRREKEGVFIELGVDGVPDIPISKTYAESVNAWLLG
jgi:DNA-binding LytR/AlgR family response regulator